MIIICAIQCHANDSAQFMKGKMDGVYFNCMFYACVTHTQREFIYLVVPLQTPTTSEYISTTSFLQEILIWMPFYDDLLYCWRNAFELVQIPKAPTHSTQNGSISISLINLASHEKANKPFEIQRISTKQKTSVVLKFNWFFLVHEDGINSALVLNASSKFHLN